MNRSTEEVGTVLVVDDNPLILNVLKGLLKSQDIQVCASENGEEALTVLSSRKIDLILCDVMMPRMDGYALHSAVRKCPEYSHIPFVFLTALDNQEEVEHGQEIGADDYLTKPFDPKSLISVVRGKILRSRQLSKSVDEKYDLYRKRIVHTLSHEFRTPLVAINTGTELLLDERQVLDQKKTLTLLEAVRRGGERLEKLVNDFMTLQQIEAGVSQRFFDQKVQTLSMGSFISEFFEEVQEIYVPPRALFTLRMALIEENVRICEMQIRDILLRLCDNAVKFSQGPAEVEIAAYSQLNEVIIEIRDRGIGFDTARVTEATDLFGQLNRDKLEQQGGGLGLTIATRHAVMNGGRLEFESRPEGGSVVSLILPILPRSGSAE